MEEGAPTDDILKAIEDLSKIYRIDISLTGKTPGSNKKVSMWQSRLETGKVNVLQSHVYTYLTDFVGRDKDVDFNYEMTMKICGKNGTKKKRLT